MVTNGYTNTIFYSVYIPMYVVRYSRPPWWFLVSVQTRRPLEQNWTWASPSQLSVGYCNQHRAPSSQNSQQC